MLNCQTHQKKRWITKYNGACFKITSANLSKVFCSTLIEQLLICINNITHSNSYIKIKNQNGYKETEERKQKRNKQEKMETG